jgi:hypothetical protein
MTAVEWYFQCEYDEVVSEFNGMTLIEFDSEDRIIILKEFQSKLPHYYPYGDKADSHPHESKKG